MITKAALSRVLVSLVVLLAGCSTRSISDSGYDRWGGRDGNPTYRGELSELDVLGISRDSKITEENIVKSFKPKQPLILKKGSSIMVIQSGAMFPDDPMVKALEKYYTVATFTGVPEQDTSRFTAAPVPAASPNYALALRLAAAKGGYEKILAYWGILETAQENLGTKAVSWVPIAGWGVPDERQRMRIRLKVAVIDVKSGQWEMFTPEPIDSNAISALINRESADQGQVAFLKSKAYQAAAEDLVKRFAR